MCVLILARMANNRRLLSAMVLDELDRVARVTLLGAPRPGKATASQGSQEELLVVASAGNQVRVEELGCPTV
jgi:hypothetical protein